MVGEVRNESIASTASNRVIFQNEWGDLCSICNHEVLLLFADLVLPLIFEINKNNNFPRFNYRAQMLMKTRLNGAQKGHRLLKSKADALQMRFRLILGKIVQVDFFLNSKQIEIM